jgi:MFS family permease
MADRINTPEPSSGPSLTALVAGIVNDLQRLLRQELELARTEIRQEWDKTKTAATSMVAAAALGAMAGLLLCVMIVALLAEEAHLKWWWSFGIVGGVLALFSLLLFAVGRAKASEVRVIPPKTAETLKEDVQWIRNQT